MFNWLTRLISEKLAYGDDYKKAAVERVMQADDWQRDNPPQPVRYGR